MICFEVFADNIAERLLYDDEEFTPELSQATKVFCDKLYLHAAWERGEVEEYLPRPHFSHKGRKD